jgi:hypothetical protein
MPARPSRSRASTKAQACACADQEAKAQQEAAELARTIAGLRARMTMLRGDAGIVPDQQVRDALQVDAEMWEMVIELLQRRADRLKSGSQAPGAR